MEIVWLIICGAVVWVASAMVSWLTNLGQLLVPSPWVWLLLGLGITTWLLHED